MKKIKIEFKGFKPLIMHNGEGANPLDNRTLPDFLRKDWSDDIKTVKDAKNSLKNKRGKTDKDLIKLSKLDFYSALYLNNKNQVIIPSENIERAIETQATETKKGTLVKRAVSVPNDAILDHKNKNKALKSLYDSNKYITMVKVSTSKTPATRAIFEKWSFVATIEYNNNLIDKETLMDILKLGEYYGFLSRRPKFGRYKVRLLK